MIASGVNLLSNVAATGSGKKWQGGKTMLIFMGTGTGTVKLQTQASDGSWVDVGGGSFTATGTLSVDLAPGQYRGNVATFTAVYLDLVSVPY